MKRKTYAHICVGYEGHECGVELPPRKVATSGRYSDMCDSCRREARRIYQAEYYVVHREKAQEYQKEYNRKYKKALRKRAEYRDKYSNTAKKEEREHTRSSYSHSYIMHSSPEKALKAIDRILSGKAELAAVK